MLKSTSSSPLGEEVQVVKYQVGGRYTCHHDSDDENIINRPYTIIMQLRDVDMESSGGGTWFPGSGTDLEHQKTISEWDDAEEVCRLNDACIGEDKGGTGIVVPMIRGSAISALLFMCCCCCSLFLLFYSLFLLFFIIIIYYDN